MSRSRRKSYHYVCCGATPKEGKQRTSRRLRRKAREELKTDEAIKPRLQDKNRGRAGSKNRDYGWNDFGDGRVYSDTEEMSRK